MDNLRTAHKYNPLKVFGLIGVFLIGLGVVYALGPLLQYFQVQRIEEWAIYRLSAVVVLVVSGVNIVFFGVVANVVLAATHRMPPFRNSILARILLRPFFIRYLWLLGLLMMIGAIVLNYEGLYSYIFTGTVTLHWSYVLTGSMLFLLGLSLMLWGSLMRAVTTISEQRSLPPGER